MKIEIDWEASINMGKNNSIWINNNRGQKIVRLDYTAGGFAIICFKPVKIFNQFKAKKKVQRKREAGHEGH